ncbi:MAG: 4Fe-4S dicluster domain-containing protein [Myxococcales bacterium]|nr:MAG: 4Fe-4S dicluster domain-containing protein [Myxococcales bacterium]
MQMDRRAFLKAMGIIGAGSLATSCNNAPLEKLHAYLTPPDEIIPGVAAYFASVCRACPAGCGIVAKTREARPIKLEGNPAHPVNRGRLCPRGQAFIQQLYARSRVSKPMLRRDGELVEVDWSEAQAELQPRLVAAKSVGLLSGLESGAFEDLAADFLGKFSVSRHVMYEPASLAALAKASELVFGKAEVPYIDLADTDYVVALGADLLDAWVSPVQFTRQWADRHSFGDGRPLALAYVGPRRNLTATAADQWFAAAPHLVGPTALALLHELAALKRSGLSSDEAATLDRLLVKLGPRPARTAIPEAALKTLAARLAKKKGLVLYGGADVVTPDATAVHAAVLAANHLIGATGRALKYGEGYCWSKAAPEARAISLIKEAGEGKFDVLFVCGANPAYTLPSAVGVKSLLADAPLVVALAYELDESARLADVVLPVHHPLESWGDYEVTRRIVGYMQPVRAPLHDTRHVGDLLIELARQAGKPLPQTDYKGYVVERWTKRYGALAALAAPSAAPVAADRPGATQPAAVFDEARWETTLVNGGEFAEAAGEPPTFAAPGVEQLNPVRQGDGPDGVQLVTPLSGLLYDGRAASCDWMIETPDSVTQTAWEAPLEIGPALAQSLDLRSGDRVKLAAQGATATIPVYVEPGMPPDVAALRFGGGRPHPKWTVPSANAMDFVAISLDVTSGQLVYTETAVTLSKAGEGKLCAVSGGTESAERFLCLAMAAKDAKRNRYPRMTRHGEEYPDEQGRFRGALAPMPHEEEGGATPHDNMYELQKHPDHRWGLVVDLDRCTGCGACVTACFAENNIPVVGRDDVAYGRELQWIRIEKHAFRTEGGEQVRFMPVMCQQCDNAPCESLCPVFASYHTEDGLNAQVYNRCIGTRYCANNCPYKVRRFNWFDYPRERPAVQQLNPDVTVRPRGVMEKCTFCVQRIREATNRAKAEGRAVRDGEIQPACVQTCPAGALSFGDFKQAEWEMTKLARDPRGYRLLDWYANTRPGVVYLRKVYSDPEDV